MTTAKKEPPKRIFSGLESEKMWDDFNNAKTVGQLKEVLFTVLCKLQHLEYQSSQEGKITKHMKGGGR